MAVVLDDMKLHEITGTKVAAGWLPAFDHDRQQKVIVDDETGSEYVLYPMNGWRARNLAEEVLGERDASLWELNKSMIVPVSVLKEMPAWDEKYYRFLEGFDRPLVLIHVVMVDPGYGFHMRVTDLPE